MILNALHYLGSANYLRRSHVSFGPKSLFYANPLSTLPCSR